MNPEQLIAYCKKSAFTSASRDASPDQFCCNFNIVPKAIDPPLQEDRSGNSYAGGNGHTAKIARANKLTGDLEEEKTSFGTFQSTFRAAKIKCKKDNLLVLL